MKAEFELTIEEGIPIIRFTHHDRSDNLEQLLLGEFIKQANKHGITIGSPGGYLETGTNNSEEYYVIAPNQPKQKL